MRSQLIGLSLAIGCGLGCAARTSDMSPLRPRVLLPPERVVDVALSSAACGVRVRLQVAPGYHIMSNQPSEPSFIATRVTLRSGQLELSAPSYPKPVPYSLAGRALATFRGDNDVLARCAEGSRAPRSAVIDVTLRYQACTESACLFPVTRRFSERLAFDSTTAGFPAP